MKLIHTGDLHIGKSMNDFHSFRISVISWTSCWKRPERKRRMPF